MHSLLIVWMTSDNGDLQVLWMRHFPIMYNCRASGNFPKQKQKTCYNFRAKLQHHSNWVKTTSAKFQSFLRGISVWSGMALTFAGLGGGRDRTVAWGTGRALWWSCTRWAMCALDRYPGSQTGTLWFRWTRTGNHCRGQQDCKEIIKEKKEENLRWNEPGNYLKQPRSRQQHAMSHCHNTQHNSLP